MKTPHRAVSHSKFAGAAPRRAGWHPSHGCAATGSHHLPGHPCRHASTEACLHATSIVGVACKKSLAPVCPTSAFALQGTHHRHHPRAAPPTRAQGELCMPPEQTTPLCSRRPNSGGPMTHANVACPTRERTGPTAPTAVKERQLRSPPGRPQCKVHEPSPPGTSRNRPPRQPPPPAPQKRAHSSLPQGRAAEDHSARGTRPRP